MKKWTTAAKLNSSINNIPVLVVIKQTTFLRYVIITTYISEILYHFKTSKIPEL